MVSVFYTFGKFNPCIFNLTNLIPVFYSVSNVVHYVKVPLKKFISNNILGR